MAAITLPHIEDANQTSYYPPLGEYEVFDNETHYYEKLKEWGLTAKEEFWYKQKTHQRLVKIIGYEVYGQTQDLNTIIIEFQDGKLSCIHPAYLKEMQAGSFGKEAFLAAGEPAVTEVKEKPKTAPAPKKQPKKKGPAPKKLELPEDKVHFSAKVKQFGLSWNHFKDDNDEVIVLEDVVIEGEEQTEVGLAWCSHSNTLKKQELSKGDQLEFDGKIVKKSLPKGKDAEEEFIVEEKITYKINNPSKIKKG
ncbi:hypothetical protein [Cytobacillus purgationiresistens]|uniref:Uncharacterized protein n=1 Tax=Cytobacillus purgationiresistens TaxID=863449 RepID=A0ABU0AB65_9BACI|nr:hypothetical protein [Cytobacillus purgationiresistens]MDQ0268496.1 hypothetical protein [Cytobacillus purgationiresistens]